MLAGLRTYLKHAKKCAWEFVTLSAERSLMIDAVDKNQLPDQSIKQIPFFKPYKGEY
jgi:hypothetical protein